MRLVIKSANQLEKGMTVYRRAGEPNNYITVVRLTKNTIQFRSWYGSTFFVTKLDKGEERNFAVLQENTDDQH